MVELLAVIVILAVITTIAVPVVASIIENSRVKVCNLNALEIERMYEDYLSIEGVDHSDVLFAQYVEQLDSEVVSEYSYSYTDGEVHCSIHSGGNEKPDEDDAVPFL